MQVIRTEYNDEFYPATEEYRREPWLVSFDGSEEGQAYVVDIFRVKGGKQHEYTLQGDANHDGVIETDLPLEYYADHLEKNYSLIAVKEYYDDAYTLISNVKSASIKDGQYTLDMRTMADDGTKLAALKITGFVESGDNTLFIGEAPSLRATRLYGTEKDNNDEADKYYMPKFVLRREGENLTSNFVTVMEPYLQSKGNKIEKIEKLAVDEGNDGDVAIKVSYGDVEDIILSSTNPEKPLVVGDITLIGNMGFIRMKDGEIKEMYLIGGTLLKKGNSFVTDKGPISGSKKQVLRKEDGEQIDGFVTDTDVPKELAGKHIVVTHSDGSTSGFKITDITTNTNGETVVQIDAEPGFKIYSDGSSEELFFPFRQWNGETGFKIENIITNCKAQ